MVDRPAAAPLAGRIAVVTGASRGLGRILAESLVASGATVAAMARPSGALEAFAARHADILTVPCDVGQPHDVRRAFEQIAASLGPPDILVNNAALCLLHRLEEMTD